MTKITTEDEETAYLNFVGSKWRNRLGPDFGDDVAIAGMGLAGEAGEVVDLLKKVIGHGKPLDRIKLVEELGDVEFYLCKIRSLYGISRTEVLETNVKKLNERYPERK